jgi:hypothetical protein
MVFSTVQISMPGTSWAFALPEVNPQGSNKNATKIIRLGITAPIDFRYLRCNSQAALSRRVNGLARNA